MNASHHPAGGASWDHRAPARPTQDGQKVAGSELGPASLCSDSGPHPRVKGSRVWLWFVMAFVIQFMAWAAWFAIAANHKVEEVPLAGSGKE